MAREGSLELRDFFNGYVAKMVKAGDCKSLYMSSSLIVTWSSLIMNSLLKIFIEPMNSGSKLKDPLIPVSANSTVWLREMTSGKGYAHLPIFAKATPFAQASSACRGKVLANVVGGLIMVRG